MGRAYFKLLILNRLKPKGVSTLTVQAQYKRAQQVESITLKAKRINELVAQIRELRGFITTNNPQWEAAQLIALGSELFGLVVAGKVRDLFHTARGEAGKKTLPLEITVEDFRIATWPWEFMYDQTQSQYICQGFNPICRSIFNLNPGGEWPEQTHRVRLLLLIGAKPNDVVTRPEEYVKQFTNLFDVHLAKGQVELVTRVNVDPATLIQDLVQQPPDIVHFYGHAAMDAARGEAYLSFERADAGPERYYATDFAQLLATHGVRLAFLNACETGVVAEDDVAARSSIAVALLNHGIPAVIATQYVMPINSASLFSSLVYSMLSTGQPLLEAVKYGRNSLKFQGKTLFCDWGIPVLYASEPDLVFFPRSAAPPKWWPKLQAAFEAGDVMDGLSKGGDAAAPGISVPSTLARPGGQSKTSVALVDLDSRVGFLPDLAERANLAQSYFHFQVAYPPVPSASATANVDGKVVVVTRVARLSEPLSNLPDVLAVDQVCCLTGYLISDPSDDDPDLNDLFSTVLPSNPNVQLISTHGLREYALKANVPFEGAVLFLCLGQLLVHDERWGLGFHKNTAGCVLDYCDNRDDILVALAPMRFDHKPCRARVKDKVLLAAIDKLMVLANGSPVAPAPTAPMPTPEQEATA